MNRVLLVGNPNVGKSAVFSRLTGVHVISSNYPGTTVELTQGHMLVDGEKALLIDLPGAYNLDIQCKADEVVMSMLDEADCIINVLDATNLERGLHMTLRLLERDVPVCLALNMWDDAKHKGITIDPERLSHELGVPVIPTVAVTGEGIKELVEAIPTAPRPNVSQRTEEQCWAEVGRLVSTVQSLQHRHHTFLEIIGDASVRPISGIPIALLVLALAFGVIRFLGEGLIGYVLEPAFDAFWKPLILQLSSLMETDGFLHAVVIGNLINGEIDFVQSFGLLTTGIFVGFVMVFPYVLAFYLVLGFLEDFGYLPRLAVLLDTLLHRMGLHGWAVIPMLLGFGCNVPGIMATRILENDRERLIASTLVSVAVPCASLQAMMWGILGPHGARYVVMVYAALFAAWIIIGRVMNKFLEGGSPELILEIPPYRIPRAATVWAKLWRRMREYLREAVPFVMLGVLIVSALNYVQFFHTIAAFTEPLFQTVLGLPQEAALAIVIGVVRKDVAVGMLAALSLTPYQFVIAVTVLSMTFPCIATFVVLWKELGLAGMLKSLTIMLISSLAVGAILNIIF